MYMPALCESAKSYISPAKSVNDKVQAVWQKTSDYLAQQ